MLNEEQAKQIKNQIIKHVESNFPEEKKNDAIEKIETMDSEELEEFLKQNNLMKNVRQETGECIFCLILSQGISSYKIFENEEALGVLEINPISKGHVLIIPKKHGKKVSKKIHSISKEISSLIKIRLKPKEVIFSENNLFGHSVLNIIPVYKDETSDSKRYLAKKEELEEVQKLLTEKSKEKREKIKEKSIKKEDKIFEKKKWLPKRMP